MGTGLYKKLGWALTGLECDEKTGKLTDPRINTAALASRPEDIGPPYLAYLKALRDAAPENSDEWFDLMMTISMIEAARETEKISPWPITRDADSGRPDVLMIQPVGFSHWTRYGDQIDHAEENSLHADEWGRIVEMPYGIYPFEGLYMDSRNGRRLDSTAKRMIDRMLDEKDKDPEKSEVRQKVATRLARTLGFEDVEQARKYIAPVVPADVRHIASWLNLFNGPDVWLQLRPVLYAYWS